MFERMEVAEQAYKGGKPSKTPTRSEANRAVHVRKLNKGEFNLLTKPKKGRTGKLKTKNAGHPSDAPTGAKNTCLLHVSRHFLEECKILKVYSKKEAAQRTHKTIDTRSSGNNKRGKVV